MAITLLKDQTDLEGTVIFLNAAVKAYLENNKNKPDPKFKHLEEMMAANLYLTDLRGAKPNQQKHNEIDLVGFNKNNEVICFTLHTSQQLTVTGFIKTSVEHMSQQSQQKTKDIQENLGFAVEEGLNPPVP